MVEHHNQSLDFEDFELFLLDLDQFDGLQFLKNLFQFLLHDQQRYSETIYSLFSLIPSFYKLLLLKGSGQHRCW